MNSNATAGVSRARPRTCVCWVATAASCRVGKLDEGCRPGNMRADGSQFAADRENRRKDRGVLLDVAGALHFALGSRLRGGERRVDGRLAGESSRKLLTDG